MSKEFHRLSIGPSCCREWDTPVSDKYTGIGYKLFHRYFFFITLTTVVSYLLRYPSSSINVIDLINLWSCIHFNIIPSTSTIVIHFEKQFNNSIPSCLDDFDKCEANFSFSPDWLMKAHTDKLGRNRGNDWKGSYI